MEMRRLMEMVENAIDESTKEPNMGALSDKLGGFMPPAKKKKKKRAKKPSSMSEGYDDYDDYDDYYGDGPDFANSGSALRSSSADNPRNLPCPTCGAEDVLTPEDRMRGYQCDSCADKAENPWMQY